MEPSKHQIAIFNEVQNGKYDILVKATAGSGKTTSIVKASALIKKGLDVAFLAFNKSIVEELTSRLPDTITCSTLHSLGFRSLYKWFNPRNGFEITSFKTTKFIRDVLKNDFKLNSKDESKAIWVVNDLLDKARLNIVENEHALLSEISDAYGIIWSNDEMEIARRAYDLLKEYNEVRFNDKKLVDFTDMIYLPAINEVQMPKFDVVFIDEAQDLNKCQQILVTKIKKPKGRAIYVGDENQAIYAFAGADADSFNSLANENTVQLPLSVCYRCAKAIVREAQLIVGVESIQPFEGQIEGLVSEESWESIREGDFVVCRNNAPLFSLYFDLLAKGVKAKIKGREIETQLLALVKKVRFSEVNEGLSKLNLMIEKTEDEVRKKGNPTPEKSPKVQSLKEMVNIIRFMSEGKDMMGEVSDLLNEIFNSDVDGATLMTIHKSKGLEAQKVHFLSPELIPSKWAQTPKDYIQEENLRFVATTRGQAHLNYIKNYKTRVEVG